MVVGGIKHPIISAALGFVYLVARYFYFTGYSSGDPQKRLVIGYVFLAIQLFFFISFVLFGFTFCFISFYVLRISLLDALK